MCGIAGLYNFGAVAVSETDVVCRMRDVMSHRGPDSAGLYESPSHRVVLAHRRLSIVDLSSAGHQPMGNEDGAVQVTFNGEIYNHLCVREQLASRHQYRSHSDTESIVHLYEDLGADCVRQLDGMFAFGIWDDKRQQLLLARDRLGKKPLYYTKRGGKLLFASEIKALLKHPDVHRELNLEALSAYLTFSNIPAPLTLFEGIFKLPAAHTLVCNRTGDLSIQRYWSPLDADSWDSHPCEEEAIEQVRTLLREAVAKRLMSDVPIGAFLSGGVDSSTNVALMSQLTSEPLRTFSVAFEGFGEDENFHDIPYARRVAKQFGCRHEEISVNADECRNALPEIAYQQDEPLGDPACIPMHFVCRAAREHGVVVVLVGEGSDEVFGGYPDFASTLKSYQSRWQPLERLPRSMRSTLYQASRLFPVSDGRQDILRRSAAGEPFYWGLDVVFWDTEKRRLINPGFRSRMGASSGAIVKKYYGEILARRPDADFLQQMSYVELSNRLTELLLMRVDKFSMAHSLEARAPFLDYKLVSYALSLPERMKISDGQTKLILKKAVEGLLPSDVIYRKKQGFRVPLPAWLRGDLATWAEHQLFNSRIRERGIFNYDYVRELWRRHQVRTQDHSFDLWCLINLSAWYERWFG
jgi:asparagine synthase (glutamine-hydrolysing)